VMRSLAKEPEARYQSCRELLEDLRSYRSLGGHDRGPDATLISPREGPGSPFATPTTPLRPLQQDDSMAAGIARSLQNRATSPSQTPSIRRTGPMPPYVEPPEKKSNTVATVLAAIFLICVIVYGVMRLRPELEAARQLNKRPHADSPAATPPTPRSIQPDSSTPVDNATSPTAPAADSSTSAPADSGDSSGTNIETPAPAPAPVTAKKEVLVSSAAADYKRQIDEALADKHLTGRVKVRASGDSLTLAGKLRPAEHASLLRFMRNAPANVHVVDDILYDDAPVADNAQGDNGAHPVPAADHGAIHVVTDVVGATATLFPSNGRLITQCQTPCSFNNLEPMQYSLQIKKDGYLPVQTAFDLRAAQVLDRKFNLQALANGLFVSSRPPGADIFINGAKQSGQTPATLPLGPGQYDLVLRLQGYEAYSGHIQVKDKVQTTLDVELKERSQSRVAWAQVDSTPTGAEIFVDGTSTAQFSPARVQLPAGTHVITLKLNGYQVVRRQVQASEGGTVHLNETLHLK